MNPYFSDYLDVSPNGRIEYLRFMIELADIAIRNRDDPQIAKETVEKAYPCTSTRSILPLSFIFSFSDK